jgi:peptidoglycan/xylan/chitin deacetylase (PgdA/CDA1 family)
MNVDMVAVVVCFVVLTWLLWFVWTVIRGHVRSRWWQGARIAAAAVIALVLVAWGTYWLMNSRTVQLIGDHVARVDTQRKVVALTFDDGPNDAYVGELVGDLRQYGVRGTFYVIGAEAAAHPAALRTLVVAGEELGNHTYHHRRLVFVSTTTARNELAATDAVIRGAGYTGHITVRPPYAKKLLSLPFELASDERTTVMWDLEPDSLPTGMGPEAMAQYVVDNVRPGSIIEVHPWEAGNAATRKALPLIIAALQNDGYDLVTVSQLLALRP